jgi:hypothetical protein
MFRLLINIIIPQLKDLPEETPLIRIFRVSRPRKPVQDTSLPYCKDPFFLPSIPDTLPSFPPEKIRTVPGSRDKKRTSSHKLLVRIHNTQSHFHTAAGYFRLGNVQVSLQIRFISPKIGYFSIHSSISNIPLLRIYIPLRSLFAHFIVFLFMPIKTLI